MRIISADAEAVLQIGKQGENASTQIDFGAFAAACLADYGAGTLTLVHQRKTDEGPYAIALSNNVWTVTSADVAVPGTGLAELTYTVGSVVRKSLKWKTCTLGALGETVTPPAAWQGYVDQVTAQVAHVTGMTVSAETAAGTTPTVTKGTDAQGNVHLTFGLVKGKDGSDASVTADNIASALGYTPADNADLAGKMNATRPTGSGSLSIDRKTGSTVGANSVAVGYDATASAQCAFAEGGGTTASGNFSHAEGNRTVASGNSSHAEGYYTEASGTYSTARGCRTKATGINAVSSGQDTIASGNLSAASGRKSSAEGMESFAHGNFARATQESQFVVGYANAPQNDSIFEVGNGLDADGNPDSSANTEPATRQNAFRVTRDGKAIAQTGLQIGDTAIDEEALQQIAALPETVAGKQDAISDLETIRSKANSAVQIETDPTVPSWAKSESKPTYQANEIGLGDTTVGAVLSEQSEDIAEIRNTGATASNGQVWTASADGAGWADAQGGGGSGDVTKTYVDAQDAKLKNLIDAVYQSGVDIKPSEAVTGYYYTGTVGSTVTKAAHAGSVYFPVIDVSAFIGKTVTVTRDAIKRDSVRCVGFCDEDGVISEIHMEKEFANAEYTLTVTNTHMFVSTASVIASSFAVKIPEYWGCASKQDISNFKAELNNKKVYHISFDDVIQCLEDITANAGTYTSVFDNSFLTWCKEMHDKYGATFSMYVFYRDKECNVGWTLADCTSVFAPEFSANADWLKFGFHAYEQGQTATSRESTIDTDYANTITQLIRITGSIDCIDRMPRLQSFTGTLTALQKLRDCDCGCIGFLAAKDIDEDTPRDSYYFDDDEQAYLNKHFYMYDSVNRLHFVKTSYSWGQYTSTSDIETLPKYANINRYVEIFIHENQLDSNKTHLESRISACARTHKPVFLQDVLTY